ncbi:MAG: AbiV family abortive infection protein [Pseudolabrys sp.]|nr:AbiV family abortive infection protein [Pseudolabrys sp.]
MPAISPPIWDRCLDQAESFVAAAGLLDPKASTHIIYHLSLLALEETGKAGMLKGRAVRRQRADDSAIDPWLTSHRRKLAWAIWSPMTRIDPADFVRAQAFAEQAHARRLGSLYVDPADDLDMPPPAERISEMDALSTLRLARSRLAYERGLSTPELAIDDVTEWFLEAVSDPEASARLFSRPFLDKYEALDGDVRAWSQWARDEFDRLEGEIRETIARELARPPVDAANAKPRWRGNATVHTPSHALRPKTLARWNAQLNVIQLLWTGKKDPFTLQILLEDSTALPGLPGQLVSLAKIALACLNIGSLGYFWFERAGFQQEMFNEVWDLELKRPLKLRGPESFWGDGRAVALTETHIDHAVRCLTAFAPLPEPVAESIFKPYFDGLAFIAKSDAYYNLDLLARQAFVSSLAGALHHWGDWDGQEETFEAAFHAAFKSFIPDPQHRKQMFPALTSTGDPGETTLVNLRSAKQLVDLYLIDVAARTWRMSLNAAVGSQG